MRAVETLLLLQKNLSKKDSVAQLDRELATRVQKVNAEEVVSTRFTCDDIGVEVDQKDWGLAKNILWDDLWDLADPIYDYLREVDGKRLFLYDTSYRSKEPAYMEPPMLANGAIKSRPSRLLLLKGKCDSAHREAKHHAVVVPVCPSVYCGGGVRVTRRDRHFQIFKGAIAFTPGSYELKGLTMGVQAYLLWEEDLTPAEFVPELHSEDSEPYEYPVKVTREFELPDTFCFVLQHKYQYPSLSNLDGFDWLFVDSLRAQGYRLEMHTAVVKDQQLRLLDKGLKQVHPEVTQWFPLGFWHAYHESEAGLFTYAVLATSPKRKLEE